MTAPPRRSCAGTDDDLAKLGRLNGALNRLGARPLVVVADARALDDDALALLVAATADRLATVSRLMAEQAR